MKVILCFCTYSSQQRPSCRGLLQHSNLQGKKRKCNIGKKDGSSTMVLFRGKKSTHTVHKKVYVWPCCYTLLCMAKGQSLIVLPVEIGIERGENTNISPHHPTDCNINQQHLQPSILFRGCILQAFLKSTFFCGCQRGLSSS